MREQGLVVDESRGAEAPTYWCSPFNCAEPTHSQVL